MIRTVAVLSAIGLAACGSGGAPIAGDPDVPDGATTVAVDRVLDGDSLVLRIDGTEREARLIGVNAPERDECWGDEAKDRLSALVDARDIAFTTDIEATDRYGRLLVYVWTDDGTFVNRDLAGTGDAIARGFPPNTTRQPEIDAAGSEARAAGTGMWSGCASASTGVELAATNPDPPGPDEDHLVDEWVAFVSTEDVDVSGWTLRDGSTANRFTFPDGARFTAGETVRVRTGCGVDGPNDLHWCSDTPVWNNAGDEVMLVDAAGLIVLAEAYGP